MEAIWDGLYDAAKRVQNERKISDYIDAGGVAAATLSSSGKIYTGVCVDTCSTLGICARQICILKDMAEIIFRLRFQNPLSY